MKFAANSIFALCKAYKGKELKENDYVALSSCKSLGEFLSNMQSKTYYSKFFSKASPSALSLEDSAANAVLGRFLSICKFQKMIGENFFEYFITKIEIEEILKITMLALGNNAQAYAEEISPSVQSLCHLDLYALSRCKNEDEIAQFLLSSKYGNVYKKCINSEQRRYIDFENAFDSFFADYTVCLFKKSKSLSQNSELMSLIKQQNDILLTKRIFRLLTYYPQSLQDANNYDANLMLSEFSAKQFKALKEAKTKSEFELALSHSKYKSMLQNDQYSPFEAERFYFLKIEKAFKFSTDANTLLYCYFMFLLAEHKNLIKIIEGIKYKMPPEQIRQGLLL